MEPTTPFRLDGKVALVTGGASGIGERTCRAFSQAGASVIVADIDTNKAEALAAELPGSRAMHCDITSEESVKHVFQQIPHLDLLVNNAGIGLVGGVTETEVSDFEKIFKVKVADVRTLNNEGKLRRRGRFAGYRSDWKKVYVKLQAGEKMPEYAEI